jgi:hypothetical protein
VAKQAGLHADARLRLKQIPPAVTLGEQDDPFSFGSEAVSVRAGAEFLPPRHLDLIDKNRLYYFA